LTTHLGIILFNDQLDTQFPLVHVHFNSLLVSSIQVLIIRRFWYLVYVTLCRWPSGMQVCNRSSNIINYPILNLKISYSRFMILNTEPKWNLKLH